MPWGREKICLGVIDGHWIALDFSSCRTRTYNFNFIHCHYCSTCPIHILYKWLLTIMTTTKTYKANSGGCGTIVIFPNTIPLECFFLSCHVLTVLNNRLLLMPFLCRGITHRKLRPNVIVVETTIEIFTFWPRPIHSYVLSDNLAFPSTMVWILQNARQPTSDSLVIVITVATPTYPLSK